MASGGAEATLDSDKYAHFHGYNFDDEVAFLRGWEHVSAAKQTSEDDKLKAKLFYYTKKFKPVCLEEYSEWLKVSHPTGSLDKEGSSEEVKSDSPVLANAAETQPKGSNSDSQQASAEAPSNSSGVAEDGEAALSFQELVECLEEGRPVPGIKKVDAPPTLSDPTPSMLDRRRKPWERDE